MLRPTTLGTGHVTVCVSLFLFWDIIDIFPPKAFGTEHVNTILYIEYLLESIYGTST